MSKYTFENTSKLGRPVRVFDATGEELKYVVACDTETGEVERFVRNGNRFVMNAMGDGIEILTEFMPAPLRVEFLTEEVSHV